MLKIIILSFVAIFPFAPLTSHAGSLSTVKVSFKTLSCDGTKGLASVDADRIVKIQSIKCDPGSAVNEVYQVLVSGEPGSGLTYRVFETTEKEAERLQREVDAYQHSKERSLERSDRLIIEHDEHRGGTYGNQPGNKYGK
ncbi:MAG: hypothetical protein HY751_14265 [Nitrospinae bacterium]|nr:hypothetical protein [Nitrospinota bacterium]